MSKETQYEICPKCKKDILFSCSEREEKMCYRCIDRAIEHSNERAEWNYYHNER